MNLGEKMPQQDSQVPPLRLVMAGGLSFVAVASKGLGIVHVFRHGAGTLIVRVPSVVVSLATHVEFPVSFSGSLCT